MEIFSRSHKCLFVHSRKPFQSRRHHLSSFHDSWAIRTYSLWQDQWLLVFKWIQKRTILQEKQEFKESSSNSRCYCPACKTDYFSEQYMGIVIRTSMHNPQTKWMGMDKGRKQMDTSTNDFVWNRKSMHRVNQVLLFCWSMQKKSMCQSRTWLHWTLQLQMSKLTFITVNNI